jgi:hypothetical protein
VGADAVISADHLKRIAALNLTPEAFQVILSILAELQGADDARRKEDDERRARDRERKSRRKSTEIPSPFQGNSMETPRKISPDPSKKERKIPETDKESVSGAATGPTQAELESELFRRGRQVCGKSSGGMITTLLKAVQYNVALARSVIETASTKHDAREYVAGAIRNHNGRHNDPKSAVAACDRLIDKLGGMEAANAYVPGSSGPAPLVLDFGQVPAGPKLISSR